MGRCIPLPGGGFICGVRDNRPQCATPGCYRRADYECDYELQLELMPGGTPKSCSRAMCEQHRNRVGEDTDYCLPHLNLSRKARRAP